MLKFFVFSLVALALIPASGGAQEGPSPKGYWVYLGTYTSPEGSRGIYRSLFDPANGKLSEPELAAEIDSPSFLHISPDGKSLYAVNESNAEGDVVSYELDPQSGQLSRSATLRSGGLSPPVSRALGIHFASGGLGDCLVGGMGRRRRYFAVVIVNGIIGFIQESSAAKALAALARTTVTEAAVVRAGDKTASHFLPVDLVPGDIVLLQSGDKVPADLRLIYCRDLQIDESALTGESVPVSKQTAALTVEDVTLADRQNLVFTSTLVTYGQGSCSPLVAVRKWARSHA